MGNWFFILVTTLFFFSIEGKSSQKDDSLITEEQLGIEYLNNTNKILGEQLNKLTEAQWNYATDINDQTSNAQVCYSI